MEDEMSKSCALALGPSTAAQEKASQHGITPGGWRTQRSGGRNASCDRKVRNTCNVGHRHQHWPLETGRVVGSRGFWWLPGGGSNCREAGEVWPQLWAGSAQEGSWRGGGGPVGKLGGYVCVGPVQGAARGLQKSNYSEINEFGAFRGKCLRLFVNINHMYFVC